MHFLRYGPDVERRGEDEDATFAGIAEAFTKMGESVRENEGRAVRVSHAKSTGLLKGRLVVDDGLPPELAQGLFARPSEHDVLVRFAQGPGETLGDEVSTHRGMAVKILGVEGERIPEAKEQATQDWLTEARETAFINADASGFLLNLKTGVSNAPSLPEGVKAAVSKVSRATNAALEAVGVSSRMLGFFGHPPLHPLSENYFSQAPIRWGNHVAKLGFYPTEETKRGLAEEIDARDFDAFRNAMVDRFARQSAEFEVRVQLATDLDDTPVEDASVRWPEDKTPYRRVGRIVLPSQVAWSEGRSEYFDGKLSFQPANSLADHRPLGQIMRARLFLYDRLVAFRQGSEGLRKVEPRSLAEVPD